jgi:hypothetical protein
MPIEIPPALQAMMISIGFGFDLRRSGRRWRSRHRRRMRSYETAELRMSGSRLSFLLLDPIEIGLPCAARRISIGG